MKVIFNIDISSLTNIYSFIHYLLVSKAFRFILTDRLFKNVTFHFQSYFVGRIKSEQPVCLIVSPLTSSSLVTFPSRGISPSSTQYPETALPINPDTGNDDKAYIYIYSTFLYFNTIENRVYASFNSRITDSSLFIRELIFDSIWTTIWTNWNVITLFCLNFPDSSSGISLTFDSIWFEKLPINRSCKFTSCRNTSSESKPIQLLFSYRIFVSFLRAFHLATKFLNFKLQR